MFTTLARSILLISLLTSSVAFAQRGKGKAPAPAAATPAAQQPSPESAAVQSATGGSKIKDSKFRIQLGIMTGLQTNPIQTNKIVQGDVDTMTSTVNTINFGSTNPQASINNQSSVVYAVPVGVSLQTVFFDFLRVRLHATYDFPITITNQYVDKSSGVDKTYTSELRVTQVQIPLLFMFDIPVSKENTIYLGGGPTLYWGRIEKGIREDSPTSGKSDLDRIEGIAYGPTFIIGIQRRLGSTVSIHADILYQAGARGGFKDTIQNTGSDGTTNPLNGFSDLSKNHGTEKTANGTFNDGTPQIMNFEGIRFLVGLNIHLDL